MFWAFQEPYFTDFDPLVLMEIYSARAFIQVHNTHVEADGAVDPDSSSAPLSKGKKQAKQQRENESAQDLVHEIKSSIQYKS